MKRRADAAEAFRPTEAGNLPESWRLVLLGDMFDVQQGKALSPAARMRHSPRPFLRTSNVLWGHLDLQNHLHRLRKRQSEVLPEFVMYWMQAALLHLGLYGGIGNKTTIPNLSAARLKQLPIPLPPFAEQRAIAEVLSTIRVSVEVQEKMVLALRELRVATMAKLFREGLCGEPLKQTEIGEIPKGWDLRDLETIAAVSTGTTPSTTRDDYFGGPVPFVKTAEINDNVLATTQQHVSLLAVRNYGLRIYPAGSVLLAMYGQGKTRGRVSLLAVPAATTQNTAAIEPGPELDGQFLWFYLLSQYNALRRTGNLGHLSHLNLSYVKALRIPFPPLDEQKEIANILALLQGRLETTRHICHRQQSTFSSMLNLVMTGQVRIPVPA